MADQFTAKEHVERIQGAQDQLILLIQHICNEAVSAIQSDDPRAIEKHLEKLRQHRLVWNTDSEELASAIEYAFEQLGTQTGHLKALVRSSKFTNTPERVQVSTRPSLGKQARRDNPTERTWVMFDDDFEKNGLAEVAIPAWLVVAVYLVIPGVAIVGLLAIVGYGMVRLLS